VSNLDERDLLAHELHNRAREVGGHPIGLDAVRGSARRIRRTRRVVAGAVAAVVLAVAVPAGVSLSHELSSSAPQPVAPRPSEGPTVTDRAEPRPDGPVELTTTGLPRGADPRVPYIQVRPGRLVTPDGTVDLRTAYWQVLPYADGWIAADSAGRIDLLDADGTVRSSVPAVNGAVTLAASSDGSRVGYAERSGPGSVTLVSAPTDGSDPDTWPVTVDRFEEVRPVGYVDDEALVWMNPLGETPEVSVARPGQPMTPLRGFLRVTGASSASGLVSGLVSYGAESCWGVMEPAASTTELAWRTCDWSLGEFSPDGRYVIAGDPGDDGLGDPRLAILDAGTGEVVVDYQQDRDGRVVLPQVVWEDDDTVLALAVDGKGRYVMLRADTAGNLERASEPVPGGMNYPVWFATAPHT
jgi:hypothetical protein